MPKFLEDRLRRQAAKEGLTGRKADNYVYGAMNNLGAMHGNKETAKGRRMEAKHDAKASGHAQTHRHRMSGSHDGMYVTEHHRGAKRKG